MPLIHLGVWLLQMMHFWIGFETPNKNPGDFYRSGISLKRNSTQVCNSKDKVIVICLTKAFVQWAQQLWSHHGTVHAAHSWALKSWKSATRW